MNKTIALAVAAITAAAYAAPASAHVGLDLPASLSSGFAHPLSGLDHMAAMIAVGLWAALKGGKALWIWPAAFAGVMLAGATAGMAAIPVPLVEPAILASVIVLGLLAALAVAAPVAGGAAIVATFAFFHGHAHGANLPTTAQSLPYFAGFISATALLHAAGLLIGHVGTGRRILARSAGLATAIAGLGMAAGTI